jgi:hypothetical protein
MSDTRCRIPDTGIQYPVSSIQYPVSRMNLAVITTVGSNAGDNFIYEGFRNIFPAKHYGSIFLINKASIPKTNNYKRLIDASDLVVVCGSPVFYEGCYRMKWQNKILEYSERSGKRILLFAVGSNFRCSVDGIVELPDTTKDSNYADFASRYNKAILGDFIVRDRYCSQFLKNMGFDNVRQVICPSFFAGNGPLCVNDRDLIFIIWGDAYWNCIVPSRRILKICKEVQKVFHERFSNKKVVWVCHDLGSYTRLVQHVARCDVLFSNNYMDFFKYYSRCYFAFSVKVHGSMLLASMGVPSLLLQLDSRAAVIEALDEDYATPSDSLDQLMDMCDEKLRNADKYRDKTGALKSKYREDYKELFNSLGFV